MRCPHHRHRSLIVATVVALVTVAQPAMAQTPVPVEPPGTPGTIVFVGAVGVSFRADTGTLPRGCNPTEVVQLITAFLDAFNRGDQQELPEFFPEVADPAREDAFHWYAVNGPPSGFTAMTRDELMTYIAERRTHDERMTLRQIEYGTDPYWELGERGIGFTLDVLRSAEDVPIHEAGAKGTIDCRAQTITTWSMGDRGVVPDDWFGTPPATPAG